jgi:uncharacterized membrane protein YeiH
VEQTTFAFVIEMFAVIAFAISGMITAARKHMDFVGTYVLANVTAFGGGTVRDLLLDRRPLFWVQHWEYPAFVLVMCVLFVYSRRVYESASRWDLRFDFVDALGLGLYGVSGTVMARAAGMPLFVAPLFGVITATFGGVARDVVGNEIPVIFRPGGLYATAVFLGGWLVVVMPMLGVSTASAGIIAFIAIVAMRMVSLVLHVTLPRPNWLRELQRKDEISGADDSRGP